MVTKEQLLIEKLQGIYDRAMASSTPRGFFLALYEYLDVYDIDPKTDAINATISDSAIKDSAKRDDLEVIASKEMEEVYKEIKKYIQEVRITNKVVLDEVIAYEQTVAGTRTSSNGSTRSKYGSLTYALMTLVEDKESNHLGFCRKFGTISDEGRIQTWSFSPNYKKWEEEDRVLERLKPTKIWFSWDKVVTFYGVYKDYEKIQDSYLDKGKIWDTFGVGLLFEEIRSILDDRHRSSKPPAEYKLDDYRTHLQRLHSFGVEFLLTHVPDISTKLVWNYISETGTLLVCGKNITFKKETFRAKVFALLAAKQKAKEWSFGDILRKIQGIEMPSRKDMDKAYYACSGINERIAKEALISDFLIVTTLTAKVNTKYL